MTTEKAENRYHVLVEKIFFERYTPGLTEISWARTDLESAAASLGIVLPKNLGDVIYSIRYRNPMPKGILATQPEGMEWVISGKGRALYQFRLVPFNRIRPRDDMAVVKIPDATPEIIRAYALTDEQALLARIRYNRLIDVFLGIASYSLQNHLRTTVKGVGQIEIDEVYVGVDRRGRQFIIPVQAKGGTDQLSVIQTEQDILFCAEKYPDLIVRAVSAQFLDDDLIVLFELAVQDQQIKIVEERHYRLVSSDKISKLDLESYDR